jgi:hypothetical protein
MAKALRLLSRLKMQNNTDPRHFGEPTQCGSVTIDEYGVSVVLVLRQSVPAFSPVLWIGIVLMSIRINLSKFTLFYHSR